MIADRIDTIDGVIGVAGGKGGVGKSMVASLLAAMLSERSYRTGLFDLDFTSPSTHIILGIEGVHPEERNGIVPPEVHGFQYMSIVYYSGRRASPLRGEDVTNALIELLAVTRWSNLDYLVIDMPPGIGDATLDVIRLIDKIRFLLVTTPSRLAFETVRKMVDLLQDLKVPILGVVENMKMKESSFVEREVARRSLTFCGSVSFDPMLEDAIGSVDKLLRTEFGRELKRAVDSLGLWREES